MSAEHVEARPGVYADSVTLMGVSARAQAAAGVRAALVAMATELNLGLLADLGLAAPAGVSQHDLIVAIRADDHAALAAALAAVDDALRRTHRDSTAGPGAPGRPPMTTASAITRTAGEAAGAGRGIAVISVPGRYALAEAMDALSAGCDVMIFSDNVPVEHEIALKDEAQRRGLLVMGPDCGTALVGGIGLGFANVVRKGPVGLVAASGTGAQQISCLLDAADSGCSAILGVGGRDLSAAVGGRSARTALAALDEDPDTELIVLVSKPADPAVAAAIRDYAGTLTTPVQFALTGPGQPDLTQAAEAALRAIGQPVPSWQSWPARGSPARRTAASPGALLGLFAGGTLCEEAMVIAAGRLGAIYSNVPLAPELRIDPLRPLASDEAQVVRHEMIDFGADELTAGRPHPMLDQRLRLDRLTAGATSPVTSVIMLDVVLGHGAHPDPAAELAPAIHAVLADRADLTIAVSVIGTPGDPQRLTAQVAALTDAGAHVFASNAQAARFACDQISRM